MSVRGLLVGAVVLAVLSGAVWWSERHKTDEDAKGSKDNPKLVSLKDDEIQRIEIRHSNAEPVVLQREKQGWQITAPKPLRTDADAVSSVVSSMSGLTWDRLVEEKASDLSTFGLATPAVQVTVEGGKNQKKTLLVGDETPTGGSWFAKLEGDPRVFSISSGTKGSVDKTSKDLRDKRLLPFEEGKLTRVELAAKGQPVEFGRNGENEWQIVKPRPLRADNWGVEELVRKLHELRMDPATSDEDEKKNIASFASGTRIASVTITDSSGSQTLDVRKSGDQYLAKSSALEGVWKVGNDVGEGLNKSLDDLRAKKLFDFGFNEPSKIDIRDAGKTYSFLKNGEKWWFNGKEMDSTSVQSLIDKLRDLSASKFVEAGFTTPALEISVTSMNGKRTEKVLLSKGASAWFAKRENEPTVYEVENSRVEEIQRAAADVKAPPPPPKK